MTLCLKSSLPLVGCFSHDDFTYARAPSRDEILIKKLTHLSGGDMAKLLSVVPENLSLVVRVAERNAVVAAD